MKFENLPPRLQVLPTDHRGYPVPWFVAKIDGEYDFRVVDPEKFAAAIRLHRCWVCGQGLGRWLAFPIGPMCALTRTVSEPPSHRECAEWSIRHCPFLANPSFVRDHGNVPQGVDQPAGLALMRNPGVVCLWITRTFETFRPPVAPGQTRLPLLTMGDPHEVTWWREGRPATREEVMTSIDGGMPTLLQAAAHDGAVAFEHMNRQYERVKGLLPA